MGFGVPFFGIESARQFAKKFGGTVRTNSTRAKHPFRVAMSKSQYVKYKNYKPSRSF